MKTHDNIPQGPLPITQKDHIQNNLRAVEKIDINKT